MTDTQNSIVMTRTLYRAPWGWLMPEVSDEGLYAIHFIKEKDNLPPDVFKSTDENRVTVPLLEQTLEELDEYFSGKRILFSVPLAPLPKNGFLPYILALQRVSYGKTVTYALLSEQARAFRACSDNKKGGARAAASACAKNRLPIVIPCHRVLPKQGGIGGFAGTPPVKEWLLTHERHNTAF